MRVVVGAGQMLFSDGVSLGTGCQPNCETVRLLENKEEEIHVV